MDRLISNHTVPLEKADRAPKKVIDPTPQYATDGDPAKGIAATILTAAHYNSLMDEIVNAIIAGGFDPDKDDWGQLAKVIIKFVDQIDGLNNQIGGLNNHFKNIKEVGKDDNGVYVLYEEDGKDQKTYVLSPSDLDDINKRLSAAEGMIINHTNRLDNYGDEINRIFSQELPKKADLNGNISQDFNGNTLLGKMYVKGGSVEVTGGVFTQYAALATQDQITLVPSWGINQLPNNNNVWQFVSYDKDNPTDLNKVDAFIEFKKENSSYNNKPTVAIYKTLIAPTKGDIAEGYKYDQDEIFEGQVVMLGGENEITLCTDPTQVFGVYSKNPAYILNGLKEGHIPVALIGRVPVLIEGPVTRKDRITPTDHGTARALKDKSEIVIGRPLYDDLNKGTRLVECFVTAVI